MLDSFTRRAAGRTVAGLTMAALATVALAGCGSSGEVASTSPASSGAADAAPVSDGAAQVAVTLAGGSNGDECRLDFGTAAAGPVTFTVTNKDAASITEVELVSDQRILGEKENLAPGLAPVKFTVTLGGGDYQFYCPGAATENTTFTVTGAGGAIPDRRLRRPCWPRVRRTTGRTPPRPWATCRPRSTT